MSEHSMNERISAFLGNDDLLFLERYIKNGRKYKKYDTATIKDTWTQQFKNYVKNIEDLSARVDTEDIKSELQLRGEEPPYKLVEEELNKLTKLASQTLVELSPERVKEMNEGIMVDLQKFEDDAQDNH